MRFNHLLVAPTGLRDALAQKIRREAAHARAGAPARIVAKVNSLVDWPIIQELYEASQAGRSRSTSSSGAPAASGRACRDCPSASASSRSSTASSSTRRIYFFENGGAPEYYLASADWMPRNLDHRVEIAFPILDPRLQAQVREILEVQLTDSAKARLLQPDGSIDSREGPGARSPSGRRSGSTS